jgi:hypothetical protein
MPAIRAGGMGKGKGLIRIGAGGRVSELQQAKFPHGKMSGRTFTHRLKTSSSGIPTSILLMRGILLCSGPRNNWIDIIGFA